MRSLPSSCAARARVTESGVKLQTIHSAKGLQYRAVILLWADLLNAERRLLYVGLTRAEDLLAVLWSGAGSAFTVRLAAGPTAPRE